MFIASKISKRNLSGHIGALYGEGLPNPKMPELLRVICVGETQTGRKEWDIQSYADFTLSGRSASYLDLRLAEQIVKPSDVLNLQFTSGERLWYQLFKTPVLTLFPGTTGTPKAAMLTHM